MTQFYRCMHICVLLYLLANYCSAAYKKNLHVNSALDKMTPASTDVTDDNERDGPCDVIKIAVIGATNSGKSTTLNALLRGRFLPISAGGTTAYALCIKHDPKKPEGELYDRVKSSEPIAVGERDIRAKLDELNESRMDAVDSESGSMDTIPVKLELLICVPFLEYHGINALRLELYDTPGTSENKEALIYKEARQIQDNMERLILVLSIDTLSHQETTDLYDRVKDRFPRLMDDEKLLILMNKYDTVFDDVENPETALKRRKRDIKRKFNLDPDRMFYTAKHALEARCWKANFEKNKQCAFDDLRRKIERMPRMEDRLEQLESRTELEDKMELLCRIAEDSSSIQRVEKLIVDLCSLPHCV